jgi:hypothetical protein
MKEAFTEVEPSFKLLSAWNRSVPSVGEFAALAALLPI